MHLQQCLLTACVAQQMCLLTNQGVNLKSLKGFMYFFNLTLRECTAFAYLRFLVFIGSSCNPPKQEVGFRSKLSVCDLNLAGSKRNLMSLVSLLT